MDSLKEEDREINRHGSKLNTRDSKNAIHVKPAVNTLIARREDVEVQARKELYERILQTNKSKARLATLKKVGRVYIHAVVGGFSTVYWGYGLSHMA